MTQINKLDILLKQNRKLFHTQDLAILWSIKNRNSLYTSIKRLIKKGILIKVQKGLYSTIPLYQLNPLSLGSAVIHSFCYLSTESVLAREGIIMQKVYPLTFVAPISKKVEIAGNSYLFRKLNEKFLHQSFGVSYENDTFSANKERAVADMLYFNPKYYFDNPSGIDWNKVKEVQKNVGY